MRRFLPISILLNIVLAALLAYGIGWRTQTRIGSAEDFPRTAESGVPVVSSSANSSAVATDSTVAKKGPQSWRDLESSDFKKYIANLRSIGCPEETIADIIISEVNELFRARLAQVPASRRPEYKFWGGPGWVKWLKPKLDLTTEKIKRDIAREKNELLKELLGPAYAVHDFPDEASLRWEKDPFFAALPAEKRGLVLDIHLRYDNAMQELRDHRGNFMDEDDVKELARLQKEKDAALAGILTPKELAEFDMRFSETTLSLRKTLLLAFDASEPEFRAIFDAQKQMHQLSADEPARSPESRNDMAGKLREIESKLKEELGEERYLEYKTASDWEYRLLVQLTKDQGLPKEVAGKIHGLRAEVEKAAQQIRFDQTLTPDQRKQKLLEIKATTENTVSETLGEKGSKTFIRNAWWLRNLSQ